MITLYSGPLSWFSRKVEIALHEKAVPFLQVLVPFTQTAGYQPKPEEVTRINPKGQVPVLIDDGLELYDSTVIIEYLDEAYPRRANLLPTSSRERARCRLWDVYGDEVMLASVRKLMHRTEPHDQGGARWLALEAEAAKAAPQLEQCFDALEAALTEREYLCGAMSLADVSCFMAVFWSARLAGPGFGERNHLRHWYQRMLDRPAVAKVVAEIKAEDRLLSADVAGAYRSPV